MMWLIEFLHLAQYPAMQMIFPYHDRSIRSPADYTVACIEEEKHLNFNTSKCSAMLISRKRSLTITPLHYILKLVLLTWNDP